MQTKKLPQYALASLLSLGATLASAAEMEVTAKQVVSAIEGVSGVSPGQRRTHTKGTCAVGEFVGNKDAAVYSRSALFSGQPVPVIARFSLAGGNPNAADTTKSVRGMALQFKLPGDNLHHMAMLNTPILGTATPQSFFELMLALKADPATGKPDPEKMKAFKANHPESLPQAEYLASRNPPVSFANSAYWGIHTFNFINSKNKVTPVRWRFVPQDGEKTLSDEALPTTSPNFLEPALISRTQQGPVRWDMILTLGEPRDPENNPTLAWPAERKEIKVGTLSINAAMAQKGAECEAVNFDPIVMADGVMPSNDPVLLFRSSAYAVSYGKRLSGQ